MKHAQCHECKQHVPVGLDPLNREVYTAHYVEHSGLGGDLCLTTGKFISLSLRQPE